MQMQNTKTEILARLRRELLLLQTKQGVVPIAQNIRLGSLSQAFPDAVFPLGAIHEFQYADSESAAATKGFLTAVLGSLCGTSGTIVWIGRKGNVFPPALAYFGLAPDLVVFVNVSKDRDVLWILEEALKCEGVSAVVAEAPDLSFVASRRLQLAVERGMTTGFVLLPRLRNTPTACVARWEVRPQRSEVPNGLPGIGFPRWQVTLSKVRNGKPGIWEIEWAAGMLRTDSEGKLVHRIEKRKTG